MTVSILLASVHKYCTATAHINIFTVNEKTTNNLLCKEKKSTGHGKQWLSKEMEYNKTLSMFSF